MVMEKPSPLLVGREFVRQYYTLLNKAPDFLHRFYGRNSSYVHGGLDSNGQLSEAVYGQAEIHKKVMSLQFSECHTKIRHVDAHASLNDGVVVQVMGELSNNGQPMRKFLQTFVLAPEGSVANKFYVHNDIFRYEDEVFGDSEAELEEESEEEINEQEDRQPSPEPLQDSPSKTNFYEPHPVSCSNGVEEAHEEPGMELDSEVSQEPKPEELKTKDEEKDLEEFEEKAQSPVLVASPPNIQEPPKTFSWASVTSKNLPLSGSVPASGSSPLVVKAPNLQPRLEAKTDASSASIRPRDQRIRDRPFVNLRGPRSGKADESSEIDGRRLVRYPDSHQLFVGNLPHDIDESELKDFFMSKFCIFLRVMLACFILSIVSEFYSMYDLKCVLFIVSPIKHLEMLLSYESTPKPIMFRGEVRLNVEEKKTRAMRERETRGGGEDRRDTRRIDRGPGGARGIAGSGMMRDRDGRGPPSRGGAVPKPGVGTGRGTGLGEGRFNAPRR
ncbi:Ras GTPase-activating protein-binding protein 2 [Triplophysa tibetana]|uniref:Ras GTPase-activating protein-binding protein 2 n=1 Tax=Triplophysa tibetana TaxID=1572043 RepID=A0A5A9PIU5_9TELE|nr:Ras GTPase-activating protein-binding protein 2 [Triplophysa tibetana]